MASNIRKGKVPYKTTGFGEYVDEVYSLKGFFGEWAHMYRRNNLGHPLRWSDDRLMYSGLDARHAGRRRTPRIRAGTPLRLLEGEGVRVALSQRSAADAVREKNVDVQPDPLLPPRQLPGWRPSSARWKPGRATSSSSRKGLIYRETPRDGRRQRGLRLRDRGDDPARRVDVGLRRLREPVHRLLARWRSRSRPSGDAAPEGEYRAFASATDGALPLDDLRLRSVQGRRRLGR